MYNIKNKQGYLNTQEKEKVNYIYERLFEQIEPFEEKFSKDISAFTKAELVSMFDELEWVLATTFSSRKKQLSNYVEWVGEDSRPILSLTNEDIPGNYLLQNYFKDLDDLTQFIEKIIETANDDDNFEMDMNCYNMEFLTLYLLWLGFTLEEVRQLKKTDVDYDSSTITAYNGFEVKLTSPTIMEMVKKCSNVKKIKWIKHRTFVYEYEDTDYIIRNKIIGLNRNKENADPVDTSFFKRASKNLNELQGKLSLGSRKKQINLSALSNSGVFYRHKFSVKSTDIMVEFNNNICRENIKIANPSTHKKNFNQLYERWEKYFY